MEFIQLKIYTSHQGIEIVTAMLLEKGIAETVVNDPAEFSALMEKKNEYDWDYVDDSLMDQSDEEPTVLVYFDATDEGRKQVQDVKLAVMMLKSKEMEGVFGWEADLGRLYAEDTIVDDEQWKDKWKTYFKPVKITDRLVVKPTWEEYDRAKDEMIIELDPKTAFGTGTHETTSLCMEMIEAYLEPRQAVLDVGCGSGILSIGAALLGGDPVMGIDLDTEAVTVARENIQHNNVNVSIQEGDLVNGLNFKADLVAANLMADLIIRLCPDVSDQLKPNGIFISSGILVTKKDQVSDAIRDAGFEIKEIKEKGEWCAIAATKR